MISLFFISIYKSYFSLLEYPQWIPIVLWTGSRSICPLFYTCSHFRATQSIFELLLNLNSPVNNLLFDFCTRLIFIQTIYYIFGVKYMPVLCLSYFWFFSQSYFSIFISKGLTNLQGIFMYTLK